MIGCHMQDALIRTSKGGLHQPLRDTRLSTRCLGHQERIQATFVTNRPRPVRGRNRHERLEAHIDNQETVSNSRTAARYSARLAYIDTKDPNGCFRCV